MAMIVGILQVQLTIDGATSLKDKRRVVSSLKDRLHREHQVSVAEVGRQDEHRTAMLGIAAAGSSVPVCQSLLDRVLEKIRDHRGNYVADHAIEILAGH